ncbi:N-acetyltransferase [Azotobacter beijerinckii]|uniref:N-acetyltransferase n=1 Tax=Azotobacter beijerinckii TaxID=170623 RepID=A0A1H6VNL9_9GAMM|nr:arylamine N-acetyltransferase [Azotobacter beijerinckii]SEJ01685.1 N-acetyltransferase [Azotobacter beijerinckii]SEP98701.1 N-acetyltransferase [Azotobacter beijerinckii]
MRERRNEYREALAPREWIDFMPANYLNSTHPEAIFVQKLLVVRHAPSGRAILFGDTLKTIGNGQVQVASVAAETIDAVLAEPFGLPGLSGVRRSSDGEKPCQT